MSASWLPPAERPTRRPIIVFCGKGGVGKTTISLALGLEYARRGKQVVVVSSQPLTDLAVTVSLDSLRRAEGAANLLVTYIDAREILATMLERQFLTPLLAQRVLDSRIYRNLIEVAPGLKELAFLSRLRELAETRSQASGPADAVIWDAPGTGHFVETLGAPGKFDTFLSGPFASVSRDLQRFFAERANLMLVPVTTLEEMAVEETLELWRTLTGTLRLHPAGIVCNLVSPMLQASGETGDEQDALPGLSPREAADLAFVVDRHRIERHEFARLRSRVPGPFHLVRRVSEWSSDLDLLRAVAAQLTAASEREA